MVDSIMEGYVRSCMFWACAFIIDVGVDGFLHNNDTYHSVNILFLYFVNDKT